LTALPSVDKVIRIELFYTNNHTTGTILNRLFWQYSGSAGDNTTMATLASNISGYFSTHCASLLPNEASLDAVKCVDLSSDTAPLGEYTTPVDGTLSGTDNSAQVAFLVTMAIARRYRGGKPKTFLPFGTATQLQSVGTWTSAFVSDVQTGWNAFVGDITADTSAVTFVGQCNVSYYGPPNVVITNPVTGRARTVSTLRDTPIQDPITGYTYEQAVATQKRRTGRKR
jgi:hypothetical protein